MRRAVVVTGAGVISSVGDSPADLHRALVGGCSGSAIEHFEPTQYLGNRNVRPLDRLGQLVAAAAGLTLDAAGCLDAHRSSSAIGFVLGTAFAGIGTICAFDRRAIEVGPQFVSPLDFANTVLNAPAGQTAIWHRLRGPNATIAAGAASGLQAIAWGADLIANGAADAVLAGGADERFPGAICALRAAGLIGATDAGATPFDVDRRGARLGEGAAFVMLEAEETAQARCAPLRARIVGHASGVASDDDRRSAIVGDVLRDALVDAGLGIDDVDAVGAGASGSVEVDACEAVALATVFADRSAPVPIMAVKSAVGETLGASGALQVVAMLEAARARVLPGIRGLERSILDPCCLVAAAEARPLTIGTAMVYSVDAAGQCVAVVIGDLDAANGAS